jgi:pyruvate-ferredoxin/flavodoxin oxidoreductase
MTETRFAVLERTHPDAAHRFMAIAQHQTRAKFHLYEQLAKLAVGKSDST